MTDEEHMGKLADAGFEDAALSAAVAWQVIMKEQVGPEAFAALSSAISLKRIADKLDRMSTIRGAIRVMQA